MRAVRAGVVAVAVIALAAGCSDEGGGESAAVSDEFGAELSVPFDVDTTVEGLTVTVTSVSDDTDGAAQERAVEQGYRPLTVEIDAALAADASSDADLRFSLGNTSDVEVNGLPLDGAAFALSPGDEAEGAVVFQVPGPAAMQLMGADGDDVGLTRFEVQVDDATVGYHDISR